MVKGARVKGARVKAQAKPCMLDVDRALGWKALMQVQSCNDEVEGQHHISLAAVT